MNAFHSNDTPQFAPPFIWANAGGPMIRTRTEKIRSTVLGSSSVLIQCRRHLSLALDFGLSDPWQVMTGLLAARGVAEPEALRLLFTDIPGPMLVQPKTDLRVLKVSRALPDDVLFQAFLLGLCTSVFYDPSRPVIWTRTSLTRRVALFDTARFYA